MNNSDDKARLKALEGIENLLKYFVDDIATEGLTDTPLRVVKSFEERLSGYRVDLSKVLSKTFSNPSKSEDIILLRDIQFQSTCEHHMLPFIGRAHVAYIPNKRIVGLSKLARTVKALAQRLQLQERLTEEIASSLDMYLKPKGVAVIMEAQHMCMSIRGVNDCCSKMVTSKFMGEFNSRRDELFNLLRI